MTLISILLTLLSSILSLTIWICVIVAFKKRRKMAHFAMMGGKYEMGDYKLDGIEYYETYFYKTTDGSYHADLVLAYNHQLYVNRENYVNNKKKKLEN